jgi:integrase/recombinase XerD
MASLFKRKRKDGSHVWYATGYVNGQHFMQSTGTADKKLASEVLKKIDEDNVRLEQGLKPVEKMQPIMLSDFIQTYLKDRQVRGKAERTISTDCYALKRLLAFTGDCALQTISESVALHYSDSKVRAVKAASASIELRSIRAAFNWAVEKPGVKYLRSNPFARKGVIPVVDGHKMPLCLSPIEKQLFLDAIEDENHQRIFKFYLLTGCRRSEATNLEWSDIDLEQNQLTFKNTKTKNDRTIPIGLELLQVIMGLDRGAPKPFSYGSDWISHLFKLYLRLAGLREDLHLHCLRHTAASDLVRQGIHLSKVAKLLGHTSTKTTEIYTHVTVSDLREVAEALTCVG